MNPEPVPLAEPSRPPDARMVTTAGVTLLTAVMTALDSSMRTSLTLLVSGELATSPVAADGASTMFDTATAERPPAGAPATTAIAIRGRAAMPRRGGVGLLAGAGRLVHAGAACHSGFVSG